MYCGNKRKIVQVEIEVFATLFMLRALGVDNRTYLNNLLTNS